MDFYEILKETIKWGLNLKKKEADYFKCSLCVAIVANMDGYYLGVASV